MFEKNWKDWMLTTTAVHTYTLTFAGAVDDDFLASFCPEGTVATAVGHHTTLTHLRTDQAGLIGVIRRLHNLSCTLLELQLSDNYQTPLPEN